jgi:hypothetical protein
MPVSKAEYDQYLRSRDQDIAIPRVFEEGFNASVFHQAFEYIKKKQPSRDLEEYIGEPVARGLAELDDGFSGINFGSLSLSDGSSDMNIGIAYNPRDIDLKMFQFNADITNVEEKLSKKDIDERMRKIQEDRDRLAKIKPEEFAPHEPSEIERLYSNVFRQMEEGLLPTRSSLN